MSGISLDKSENNGNMLYAFWKFSRPHTIIGTSLSVLGLFAIAIAPLPTQVSAIELWQLFGTWLACICGNIYIVGLNQLEDIEIDRINKPNLPIAAGEFSRKQGQIIVIVTGILSLVIAGLLGKFVLATVGISVAIGTAYSSPPIRLKRFPFWAAMCIFTVRGAIVNLGLFLHFSQVRGKIPAIQVTPEVWVLTLFVIVFTVAIAIFKDIPDIEGDRQYNISTFTIKLGAPAVFNLSRWILTFCYLGMMLLSGFWLNQINQTFLMVTHQAILLFLWVQSWKVDLQDRVAIAQFYQFIWKLFFLEYLIFPIACLLA